MKLFTSLSTFFSRELRWVSLGKIKRFEFQRCVITNRLRLYKTWIQCLCWYSRVDLDKSSLVELIRWNGCYVLNMAERQRSSKQSYVQCVYSSSTEAHTGNERGMTYLWRRIYYVDFVKLTEKSSLVESQVRDIRCPHQTSTEANPGNERGAKTHAHNGDAEHELLWRHSNSPHNLNFLCAVT